MTERTLPFSRTTQSRMIPSLPLYRPGMYATTHPRPVHRPSGSRRCCALLVRGRGSGVEAFHVLSFTASFTREGGSYTTQPGLRRARSPIECGCAARVVPRSIAARDAAPQSTPLPRPCRRQSRRSPPTAQESIRVMPGERGRSLGIRPRGDRRHKSRRPLDAGGVPFARGGRPRRCERA